MVLHNKAVFEVQGGKTSDTGSAEMWGREFGFGFG